MVPSCPRAATSQQWSKPRTYRHPPILRNCRNGNPEAGLVALDAEPANLLF
jgi:hypothetical protein